MMVEGTMATGLVICLVAGGSLLVASVWIMGAARLWRHSVRDVGEAVRRTEIEVDEQKRLKRPD